MTLADNQNPDPIFPADLLSQPDNTKPWRVAHTKSRREKALANYLADAGIGYYLPMYKRRQTSQNRVRYSLMPLFNGYVFFKGDDFERQHALRSDQIARIIDVEAPKQLVSELRRIQQVISAEAPVYPYDYVSEGQMVRVKKGPLKDVEGIIERKDRHCRLVLSVSTIMQAMAVTIDADMVEPIT
ncbi:MAG TPA: transcription termination/antitermination NusG family protein [Desulfosalsimonadaceae bacterium]|nr:transcription termination/antitermination NusG family protein [Desulfosalsimonadaceae bacterium]